MERQEMIAGGAYIARFAMCAMTDPQGALTPGVPERGPRSPAGERETEFGSTWPALRPCGSSSGAGCCRAAPVFVEVPFRAAAFVLLGIPRNLPG